MKFNVENTSMDNKIDFTVMGLDDMTSDFLNYCMKHRDNLEYERINNVQEIITGSATLFFDDFGTIGRIDKNTVRSRKVLHLLTGI